MQIVIDPGSPVPPFEQLLAGHRRPGRRTARCRPGRSCRPSGHWPGDLGLAVNTVARAYRELEADGVVVTEGRRGTFVATTEAGASDQARVAAAAYVEVARRLGLVLPEATQLVERAWADPP